MWVVLSHPPRNRTGEPSPVNSSKDHSHRRLLDPLRRHGKMIALSTCMKSPVAIEFSAD